MGQWMGERGGCSFPNIGTTEDRGGWVLGGRSLGGKGLGTRGEEGAWE